MGDNQQRKCTPGGRNLVVCIDGTSNQFGNKNTNVVALYSQLVKSDKQLTYYNSGIGTFAQASLSQWVDNKVDLAIAHHFDRILLGAYRWLVENYQDNDRIFLFGFSRGAYQVRVLAGMIEKVGLLFKGNEEQIPFAYGIYTKIRYWLDDEQANSPPEEISMYRKVKRKLWHTMFPRLNSAFAKNFKDTFSRQEVHIHFIGAWDTVSSVGLVGGKQFPLANSADHVCLFRHALALDERRVKFLPEYVNSSLVAVDAKPERIKEVWFAGTHSDIGGGNRPNLERKIRNCSFLWMSYEATSNGLLLNAKHVEWQWDDIGQIKESLRWYWRVFEFFPLTRLTYKNATSTTRRPHMCRGRKILKDQKIHASVAFCKKPYVPKSKLTFDKKFNWEKIVDQGSTEDISWATKLQHYLELDIFDHSMATDILNHLDSVLTNEREKIDTWVIFRLSIMVLSVEGCRNLVATNSVGLLKEKLQSRLLSGTESSADPSRKEFLDGLESTLNRVQPWGLDYCAVYWKPLLVSVKLFTEAMEGISDSELHSLATHAHNGFVSAHKVFMAKLIRDEGVDILLQSVTGVFQLVEANASPLANLAPFIEELPNLAKQARECGIFIQSYAQRNLFLNRATRAGFSNIDDGIKQYKSTFEDISHAIWRKLGSGMFQLC